MMKSVAATVAVMCLAAPAIAQPQVFAARDVFELEWVAGFDVAADGRSVAFIRAGFDVMTDRARTALWIADPAGRDIRPVLTNVGTISKVVFAPRATESR
ncbi:MAG: hypothetical protein HC809_05885 [Gammaproteobacteria bacterium]|nr:hypothetical protein [Gammaproteobacteria bacterium]